jgi:hypothetical protein
MARIFDINPIGATSIKIAETGAAIFALHSRDQGSFRPTGGKVCRKATSVNRFALKLTKGVSNSFAIVGAYL